MKIFKILRLVRLSKVLRLTMYPPS
eukprot:COSAG05_NODE_6716_length_915_cov_1.721814_2_plen_24_part_01